MTNLIGQSLGRYHILEQLGEGGMATVYKAYDTRLERDVAVKVIRRGAFPSEQLERILKRFEREAKALSKLTQPNIVGVMDFGEYEGSPYLVMEYLPGGTLKHRLGRPIPWQESARLLLPIANALQFAHVQGIVHRDVKPSNILITLSGEPMLTDFGIAKILEYEEKTALTGTGIGLGTPEYMAPEQWTGQASAQSDIYSLGVVFYEMVTGRKPYVADTPAAILLKQANEPLPKPTQYVPDLPAAVEKVLLKALAKKPEDRYPDMAAFINRLDHLLAGQSKTKLPVASAKGLQPQASTLPDTQATIQQEDSLSTYDQGPIRDEALPELAKRMDSSSSTASIPLTAALPAKSKWWVWVVGACGILVLAGIVIAVLAGPGLKATQTLTPTLTPMSTLTLTLTKTISLTTTATPTFTPPTQTRTNMLAVFTGSVNSNCRVGPNQIYPIVATIMGGTPTPILGKSSSYWGDWWQVNSLKGICWVSGEQGTVSGDVSQIMVANPPPASTPVRVYLQILNASNSPIYFIAYGQSDQLFHTWKYIHTNLQPGQALSLDVTGIVGLCKVYVSFGSENERTGTKDLTIDLSSSTSWTVTWP